MTERKLEELTLEDKTIAERPILLPDHPYLASLKDFGADELIAAGIDIVATGIAGTLIEGPARFAVLPFVGPVLEKGAFFIRHAINAQRVYETTPENLRQKRMFYFKQGIKHGSANLMKDLMVHDPIYSIGVASGLCALPNVPPFILSSLSYIIGVAAVAGIDVIRNEKGYKRFKRGLERKGFTTEKYWESRFMIRGDKNPLEVMEQLAEEFQLTARGGSLFEDTYVENRLPSFNGRTGKLRLRSRARREYEKGINKWGEDKDYIHTLQVAYSRARNNCKNHLEQFNYFPVEKTKICFFLPQKNERIEDLEGEARKVAESYAAPERHYRKVSFERILFNSPELAICTDVVHAKRPYYLVELKTHDNLNLLQKAMRHIMLECPVVAVQTTHGKGDLFF
jgi:hypothetical protein